MDEAGGAAVTERRCGRALTGAVSRLPAARGLCRSDSAFVRQPEKDFCPVLLLEFLLWQVSAAQEGGRGGVSP